MIQSVKSLPAMWETQVQSLGQEDPLEKEMATHSSILVWKNPMDGEAWLATVHGVAKSRTRLSEFTIYHYLFCDQLFKRFVVVSAISTTLWTNKKMATFCSSSISSVRFSNSIVSDSLRPHGLQHTRLPCPSPTPGAYSNSYPSNR